MRFASKIRINDDEPLISVNDHRQVIESGTDVPEQAPSFCLPLNEVGITNKTVWVQLPEGRLPFEAQLTVALPGEKRGIHMSRLEQAIAEMYDKTYTDLSHYAKELAAQMISEQHGVRGNVSLVGKIPLLRESKISRRLSIDPLQRKVEVEVVRHETGLETNVTSGIGVCHITACPCTQIYTQDVYQAESPVPMPTHSQRSQTWLSLTGKSDLPSYEKLLSCLEKSLHVTQDLLKRPDEAEIVLKSHREPQFAEDSVRETARVVAETFYGLLPDSTGVEVESLSLESIHIHDVFCRLQTSLGEIGSLLNK